MGSSILLESANKLNLSTQEVNKRDTQLRRRKRAQMQNSRKLEKQELLKATIYP